MDTELQNEKKNQGELEQRANRISEMMQIKINNLDKLKHESAELKHEIESKKLQISNLNRQMGRVDTSFSREF